MFGPRFPTTDVTVIVKNNGNNGCASNRQRCLLAFGCCVVFLHQEKKPVGQLMQPMEELATASMRVSAKAVWRRKVPVM